MEVNKTVKFSISDFVSLVNPMAFKAHTTALPYRRVENYGHYYTLNLDYYITLARIIVNCDNKKEKGVTTLIKKKNELIY